MRHKLPAILLALLMLLSTSCMAARSAADLPAPVSSEDEPQESSGDTGSDASSPASSAAQEDPEPAASQSQAPISTFSLYDWWRDYIYDAVYPLQGIYPTHPAYDSSSIIEYCAKRMYHDGAEGFSYTDREATMTKAILNQYTKLYFNLELSQLDTKKLLSADGTSIIFPVSMGEDELGVNPADETLQNGSFTLASAKQQADGRVRLTVRRDDGVEIYFTMAPHKQDSYYIEKIEENFGEIPNTVKIKGTYLASDSLLYMNPRMGAGRMLSHGEIGGRMLLAYTNTRYMSTLLMSLVDTETLDEIFYELELAQDEEYLSATAKNDRIVIVTSKRIISMGEEFSDYREMQVPASLLQAAGGEIPDFDLSADRKSAVFSSQEGIVLYNFNTGSYEVLVEHPNFDPDAEGKELMSRQVFAKPCFFDGDTKVRAVLAGYESYCGMYVYDLAAGEGVTYGEEYSWLGYATVSGNRAVALNLNELHSVVPHIWMDLDTGELHALDLPREIKQLRLTGSDGALLVLGQLSDDSWQLYSFDLETMELVEQDFSISGVEPIDYIIGATENGKLLFQYFARDGEKSVTGTYLLAG